MTYQQADNILHNKPPEESRESLPPPLTAGSPVDRRMIPVLKTDLALLTRLARKRRKLREEVGGALDLTGDGDSGSELKFTIENGKPTKVVPKADKEIHHTIAELMILANTEVAKIIHKHFPDSALLRKHRSVEESSLEELRNVLTSVDVKLEGTDGASLAKALSIARQKSKEARKPFQSLLLSIATRSMTEAQYICTGDVEKGVDFSHYGLGLTEYTHFTSPIRRYCDVIVHKQLLASLANESVVRKSINFRPTVVRLKHLHHLPASEVVSVLAMNGLNNELGLNSSNDDIGDLAHDTSKLSLRNVPSNAEYLRSETAVDKRLKPYDRPEVMAICDGLNLHNRLAKRSSYECQSLFLSLYFKDHVDVTHAVVTHLRENGILVYVPKYDFKGPVYIRDTKGDIHLDPLLLGLPSTFGEPTSPDLNVVENCRRIPFGQCEWMDGIKNERLEVGVQGRKEKFVMRTFDVVHVSIACNNWDVRARVPVPRLQLVATPVVEDSIGSTKRSITTLRKAGDPREVSPSLPKKDSVDTNDDHECSVFDVLTSIRKLSRPNVAREAFCYEKTGTHSTGSSSVASAPTNQRQEVLKGRVVYGAFVNPDTRSAIQESLQSAAFAEAAQHRATLLESSRQTELEKTSESKRFERSITTRQQRLTSDKHHSRHTKG